jgi:DNA-binding CsgD family transcriptional regulator/sugar-specific transcriptional regulator TrmB
MSDTSIATGELVLSALGLDGVCVQVYLAMHSVPEADAEQLSARLGIEVPEVIDALDELSDLTLLRPGLSPAHKLRPISIERAVHTLIRQQAEQLKMQSGALTMLQSAMKELLASRPARQSDGRGDIEMVTGEEAIQSLVEQLTLRASESVWSAIPGRRPSPEALEVARPFDEEVAQRGVPSRSLYQQSVLGDRPNMEYARWLSGLGIEIRSAPMVPVRMIIVDHAVAAVLHHQPQLPVEMFVIREPALLIPLIELFQMCWAGAKPIDGLEQRNANSEAEPTAQEAAFLRLLAAGSTDEAAAKKLGVSVRTVRRMMADLMERLGATSRFEAGHRATQRGWL